MQLLRCIYLLLITITFNVNACSILKNSQSKNSLEFIWGVENSKDTKITIVLHSTTEQKRLPDQKLSKDIPLRLYKEELHPDYKYLILTICSTINGFPFATHFTLHVSSFGHKIIFSLNKLAHGSVTDKYSNALRNDIKFVYYLIE